MTSLTIIEDFYILEQNIFYILSAAKIYVINPFTFKTFKESFSTCIIPAVSFSAHALDHTQHRHSGIQYFAPQQMRSGKYKQLVSRRNKTVLKAALRNPCRWSNPVKQWKENRTVYLNPSLETLAKREEAA